MVVKGFLDTFDEWIAEDTAAREAWKILEIHQMDVCGFIGFDGELGQFDDGLVLLADVVVCY